MPSSKRGPFLIWTYAKAGRMRTCVLRRNPQRGLEIAELEGEEPRQTLIRSEPALSESQASRLQLEWWLALQEDGWREPPG